MLGDELGKAGNPDPFTRSKLRPLHSTRKQDLRFFSCHQLELTSRDVEKTGPFKYARVTERDATHRLDRALRTAEDHPRLLTHNIRKVIQCASVCSALFTVKQSGTIEEDWEASK